MQRVPENCSWYQRTLLTRPRGPSNSFLLIYTALEQQNRIERHKSDLHNFSKRRASYSVIHTRLPWKKNIKLVVWLLTFICCVSFSKPEMLQPRTRATMTLAARSVYTEHSPFFVSKGAKQIYFISWRSQLYCSTHPKTAFLDARKFKSKAPESSSWMNVTLCLCFKTSFRGNLWYGNEFDLVKCGT